MAEIEGYKVIPIKVTPDAQHPHHVYMREHHTRVMDPNKPKRRTLFLLNVPPYVTEQNLEDFFKTVGPVESVSFAARPGQNETNKWHQNCTKFSNVRPPYVFKVAYIVFQSSNSVSKALKLTSIDLYSPTSGESFVASGMQLWHTLQEQYILDEDKTQQEIDEVMQSYDCSEQAKQEAAKIAEADGDGWITVGKHGHNAGFEQKQSHINRLEDKIGRAKKKELTNFYTFQIRESKMKNIIDLRKKFEDDKKKIERLKETRRFRPF